MTTKTKNIILTIILSGFFLGIFLVICLKPADAFSNTERRSLKQFPAISIERIASGAFMKEFEDYALDQFPVREWFRSLKSTSVYKIFHQSDYDNLFFAEGHISKMEYPLHQVALNQTCQKFETVYTKYIEGTNAKTYLSIIPDKNYFLAEKHHYLSMDYEGLFSQVQKQASFMEYIDITKLLDVNDYYRTDPHWRQEKIMDVAQTLADNMGIPFTNDYEVKALDTPFYGAYSGQAALSHEGETLYYLSNKTLENCVVYDYENKKNLSVYDIEKAYGKDAYEMFLSGSLSLITIENPDASTDKELILFRDSFGSSIAPLFAEGYRKITLVDLRYIHPDKLGEFIDFQNQDILFLYSTLVLNN